MANTDKDAIYAIAEKLGWTGTEGRTTAEAIYAVASTYGYTGEHDRQTSLALNDLCSVVTGGGGGGDLDTVTVTLTTAVGVDITIYPQPYIFNDELLKANITLCNGASKTCEFVTYKGNPTGFEFSGGTAVATGDATVDEDYVEITGDCTIAFSS